MLTPMYGERARAIASGILEKKGIPVPRRGIGRLAGIGAIELSVVGAGITAAGFQCTDARGGANLSDDTRKASELVSSGLQWLQDHQGIEVIRDSLSRAQHKQARIPLEFREDHDRIMNLAPLSMLESNEHRALVFDTDVPAALDTPENRGGLTLLFAIGTMHQMSLISGFSQEESLLRVLDLYEKLGAAEQTALLSVLSQKAIDNDDNFADFLVKGANALKTEKDMQVSVLMKLERAELPYANRKVARQVFDDKGKLRLDEIGLTELRNLVHVEINESYSPELEAYIAQRVADEAQENGVELVMGFLGRAGLIEQLLMAAAEIVPADQLKAPFGALCRAFEAQTFEGLEMFDNAGLRARWELIRVQLIETSNLLSNPAATVSVPKLSMAMRNIQDALDSFVADARAQASRLRENNAAVIAKELKETGARGATPTSPTLARIRSDVGKITEVVDDFIGTVFAELSAPAQNLPKFHRVWNVALQRIVDRETLSLFLLNQLRDPYLGETTDFRQLLNDGGKFLHVAADIRPWLRRVSHWIQALPAYAWYKVIDMPGDNYQIMAGCERDTLEFAFKGWTDDLGANIEAVIHEEHVSLARTILAERLGPGFQQEADRVVALRKEMQLGEGADTSREEAIRLTLRHRGLEDAVAGLATLVEATCHNLEKEVAEYVQTHGVQRIVALRAVLRENKTEENLVASFLQPPGPITQALDADGSKTKAESEALIATHGLSAIHAAMHRIAFVRRREQPSFHNLTTLGPGETTTYLKTWLETGLTLHLFCRDNKLETQVGDRLKEYRARTANAAWRVVQAFDLDGELFDLMTSRGQNPLDEGQVLAAAPEMMGRYPEVSLEVARICAIMEHEEKNNGRPKDKAHFAKEPESVERYINEHSNDLDDEATVYIVQQYDLNAAVKKHQDQHRGTWQEAARAVIDSEEDEDLREEYKAEHKAYVYHLARKAVAEQLNVQANVATYNRLHGGALALYTARQEIVGEYIGTHGGDYSVLDQPQYRYESDGPYKKFNLAYTPSRVDLGEGERHSVEDIGKVVTADDQAALNAVSKLHNLYNAGVVQFPSTAMGEFFKARENFFTRGGVFYLSLGEGINIDAMQIGDQEEYMYFSNRRGDRIVLPTGESYRGFCVPKEFFLLYAVMTASAFRNSGSPDEARVRREAATNIMMNFAPPGKAGEFRKMVDDSFDKDLAPGTFLGDLCQSLNIQAADIEPWRQAANDFFAGNYASYFSVLGKDAFLARLPVLAKAMQTWGITMSEEEQESRELSLSLANWANKKMQGLEQINRIGPYRKLLLSVDLADEAYARCKQLGRPVKDRRDLVYAVGGPYKAGSRKGAEERPITDSRFSSALDKLLVISGSDEHLDEYFDPEAKRWVRRARERIGTVGDFRIAGTVGASDIINATPGIPVARYIDEVRERLGRYGLTDVKAYCVKYGAALWRWPIPEKVKAELLQDKQFLRKLNLLVMEERDVIKSYRNAVQGADIIDLAVGDPELLDLIDNLPEFLYRLRVENPQGIVVFADGQVGAKPRAFAVRNVVAEFKVKELFALDDAAVYGSLGLGKEVVERWREEMEKERNQAEEFLKALSEAAATQEPGAKAEAYARARAIYEQMAADCVFYNKAEHANDILKRGISETKQANPFLQCMAVSLANVKAGLPLDRLDFATWLALGGRFLLNGRMSEAQFEEVRKNFDAAINGMTEKTPDADLPQNLMAVNVAAAQKVMLKPAYEREKIEEFAEKSTGIVTVGKVGEARAIKLAGRAIRRQKKQEQLMLNERRIAFRSLCDAQHSMPAQNMCAFAVAYGNAKEAAGLPDSPMTQEGFSHLMYWTEAACLRILDTVIPDGSSSQERLQEKRAMAGRLREYFKDCVVHSDDHRRITKDISRLIELASQSLQGRGVTPQTAMPADRQIFEDIAKAGELLDMTLLASLECEVNLAHPKVQERAAVKALFNFFDKTMNAHMFDYYPFDVQPSLSDGPFDLWFTHEQKFGFSAARHRWLYPRVRRLMVSRTGLRQKDAAYQERWLGNVSDWEHPVSWRLGLGVNVDTEDQQYWFSYAKLRDAVAIMHEFEPLENPSNMNGIPEVFWDIDPALLGADESGEFSNVVSIYNHGNTTMPVAIEQGVVFEKNKMNLMLCPFPIKTYDAVQGREVLQIRDAVMYVSAERYEKLLVASGVDPAQAHDMAVRVPAEGILVAIKFREPARQEVAGGKPAFSHAAIAHSIFFNFTHPLRPDIDTLGLPLVQPLTYEAFTYLKAVVPDVLSHTQVGCPAGFVWGMADTARAKQYDEAASQKQLGHAPTPEQTEAFIKEIIRRKLIKFLEKYPFVTEVIEKPEKESGERGSELLPILSRRARREGRMQFVGSKRDMQTYLDGFGKEEVPEGMRNLDRMVDAIYEVSLTDNVVVQGVVPSVVRTLFTHEFIDEVGADRARKGTAISIDTPLFSYFRYIMARGSGGQFQSAARIVVIPTEGIGNVARGSTLRAYEDNIVNPEFREPLKRALDKAYYLSMEARQRYIRHAWPHILREYLVLNKRFGEPVGERLTAHLKANEGPIVSGFFSEQAQFAASQAGLTEFLHRWAEDLFALDEHGRDFSAAIDAEFPDLAVLFKQYLGLVLEKAGLLNLDIHYSMDDAMPMYLGDEEKNYLYVVARDDQGNHKLDDWGNVQLLPLADPSTGKATDVKLYDKDGAEIPTRDAKGDAIKVHIFVDKDGQLVEREIYDRDVSQMPDADKAKFRVSCLDGLIIEFNPGAGLWRPHDMALRMLDPKRAGEGVNGIFMPLGERAVQYHSTLTPHTELMPQAGPVDASYQGAGAELYMKKPQAPAGTNEGFVDAAAAKAREDLSKGERDRFGADDASLLLTYAALEALRAAKFNDDWDKMQAAEAESLRTPAREILANPEFQKAIRDRLMWEDTAAIQALFTDQQYLGIIEGMIVECAGQGRESVALSVVAKPVNAQEVSEILRNKKVCALAYDGASTLFTDTVSALQIDSDAHFGGADTGIAFLGVHKDWLTDDGRAARRALVSYEDGSVRLVTFVAPVLLQEAGILHLNRETERVTHAGLSALFENAHIPVFNPYHAAEAMDSKALTASACAANPAIQQPFQKPRKFDAHTTDASNKQQLSSYAWEMFRSRSMLSRGRKVINLIIKPDHGTEGDMVESFIITFDAKGDRTAGDVMLVEDDELRKAIAHMAAIKAKGDDCIFSEVRGNVTDEHGNRVSFRINACEAPEGYRADTGLAWTGADSSQTVLSKAKGATGRDINEVLWNLKFEGEFIRDKIDLGFVAYRLQQTAIEVARTLGARGIIGIDMVLEVTKDLIGNLNVAPVFLESNPRPALLSAARRLEPFTRQEKAPDSMPQAVDPGFYQMLYNQGLEPDKFLRAEYTFTEWLDIIQNRDTSGLNAFLTKRYGSQFMDEKAAEYRRVLEQARDTGMYDPHKPVLLTAVPGRIRIFGGHPDARGIMTVAVNMATEAEIISVFQRSDDQEARVISEERGEKRFRVDAADVRPDHKINSQDEWTAWASTHRPEIITKDADWDLFIKTAIAYCQGKHYGIVPFSGCRIYMGKTELSPAGGFSSSSAVAMSVTYAYDSMYGLAQPVDVLAENAEYEYTRTRGGRVDQDTIARGERGKILIMTNSPAAITGIVSFPETISAAFFNCGFTRTGTDLRVVSPKFMAEFGPDNAGRDTSFGDCVNNRSGISAALASLWLRHALREMIAINTFNGFEPWEIALLRRAEADMTYYEKEVLHNNDDEAFGFFRELVEGGRCPLPKTTLAKLLKRIPARAGYAQILVSLPEFAASAEKLFAKRGLDLEPADGGYRLREAALYALSESVRVPLFCQACNTGDVGAVMDVQRRGHDGDRVAQWNITFDGDGRPTWDPVPQVFDSGLNDEELDRLSRGETITKNGRLISEVWQYAGTFERSVEPIDFFCDLVDVWARHNKVQAAARVSAAGLGGNIAVFCEKSRIAELSDFLQKYYYNGFLKQLFDAANGAHETSLQFTYDPAQEGKVFNPGQGAQVVRGDFSISVIEQTRQQSAELLSAI